MMSHLVASQPSLFRLDHPAIFSARQVIKKTGKLGEVSVDLYDGKNLPYIDNMVNLIVAEDAGDVPTAELMRVLVPNGTAYIKSDGKWTTTVNPRPGVSEVCCGASATLLRPL